MTAVNIPSIQVSLKDRRPRTAQQLANRIINYLSEEPKTAGSSGAHLACGTYDSGHKKDMCTIVQNYGGAAKRMIKSYGKSGSCGSSYSRGKRYGALPQKRLNPLWIRGMKACLVCGTDHLARQQHS